MDFLIITIISSEILKEIDEKAILEYFSKYPVASRIERKILLSIISRNLLETKEMILKIKKHVDSVSR